jgi:hypothetical protein
MGDTVSSLEMLRRAAQAVNGVLRESEIVDALLAQAVDAFGAQAALVRLLMGRNSCKLAHVG